MSKVADWGMVKSVFADVLELAPDQRTAHLARVCATNEDLRAEVESLLAAHPHGTDFFKTLAIELGAPAVEGPCFQPGEWVAERFNIIRFLSSGGMCDVFEAEDTDLNDRVALKTLRAGGLSDWKLQAFKQEVKLARRITSDHVCRIFDVSKHKRTGRPDVLLLSMELIRGGTLASEIRSRGRIQDNQTLIWVLQIADGLEAAHRLGILHCDLKSTNVMLSPSPGGSPRAVITDFGLSRAVATENNESSLVAGTPAFMAPEQLGGAPPGVETDIYALGVVMYEMLTGELPFDDSASLSDLAMQKQVRPTAPSVLVPGLQEKWDAVVLKCLECDPNKRFHEVSDLRLALGDSATGSESMSRRSWLLLGGTALAVTVGVSVATYNARRTTPAEGKLNHNSIVVIPFEAGDPGLEYISDGLTEQLAIVLTRVPGLRVISKHSATRFKGKAEKLKEIREELRVGTILSGRIRKEGKGLAISAELLDANDGTQLWAERYLADGSDVMMARETISRAAIHTLRLQISNAQYAAVEQPSTRNPQAYNLFLLGRYHIAKRTSPNMIEGIRCFMEAVRLDNRFAAAHAALAISYSMIVTRDIMPRELVLQKCKESAATALNLDSNMAEAYLALGSTEQHYNWDWPAAEKHFRSAAAVDGGSALAHHWFSGLLSMLGKHGEALAEIGIARDLDPLSLAIGTAHGAFLHRARRHEEAVQQLRWVLARDGSFQNAYTELAVSCVHAHRVQEGITVAEQGVKLTNRAPHLLGALGYCLAIAGRKFEATQLAEELKPLYAASRSSACSIACIYIGLLDLDAGFHWLSAALSRKEPGLTILTVDPSNDPLRNDPRYHEMVARMKL